MEVVLLAVTARSLLHMNMNESCWPAALTLRRLNGIGVNFMFCHSPISKTVNHSDEISRGVI